MVHALGSGAEAPRTPRERRRRETEREIREVAERLLAEDGIEALTMGRLAAELGYTAGALYRYFPSKDALLADLLEGLAEQLHQRFLDAYGRGVAALDRQREIPPAEGALVQLLLATGIWASLAPREPVAFGLLDRALAAPRPALPGAGLELSGPALVKPFDHFVRLFEAAVRARALARGDARRRTACLWAALHGVGTVGRFGRLGVPRQPPAALVRSLVRTLFLGWRADAGQLDAAQKRAGSLGRRPRAARDSNPKR